MGERRTYGGQDCSLAGALEIIGERWTLLVLRDCFYGVRRFNDFQAHLDIPRAVLTDRLKKLVSAGILERSPTPTGNEYRLTARGTTIWPAIFAIAQWGEQNLAPRGGPRRVFSHLACGTDVEPSGWCPRCDDVPGPAQLTTRPGPGAHPGLRDDPVSRALASGRHQLLTNLLSAGDSQ